MKFKLTLAALIIAPIMLTACAKKKKRTTLNSKNKQLQLYLHRLLQNNKLRLMQSKPNLDEKNTDVVESAASEVAASEVQ
jgi:outer membrane murein-binding lipoprotein Lpp